MRVHIIRASGAEEHVEIAKDIIFADLAMRCGWVLTDQVNLRDGRIMIVDDGGLEKGLPKNEKASVLYRAVCRSTDEELFIVGDVAIIRDEDFA